MADDPTLPRTLHVAGLAMAAVLAGACFALWVYVPTWLSPIRLQSFGPLAAFGAGVALLSLAEWVWRLMIARVTKTAP